MRTALRIVAVVAFLVCVARAFGQCSANMHIAGTLVNCQCGGYAYVQSCFLLGPGCNPILNFVPCGSGCEIGEATSCKAATPQIPTAALTFQDAPKSWADCHGSSDLADLREWVKKHPSLRDNPGDHPQVRN